MMLFKKALMRIGVLAVFLALLLPVASAELYTPLSQRYIATGENDDWFYIQIHKITGNDYIGLSKADKGYVGIARNGEYIGYMFFVPAFKHPANSKWYLCPLIDAGSYNVGLGENYIDVSGSGTYTCYDYADPSSTGSADITLNQFMLYANPDASIKITANVTVNGGITPLDTGFAYIFVPLNQGVFRYAKVSGVLEDLAGSDRSLSVEKNIEFYDAFQNYIGHKFNWVDMPAGTSTIMKVVTLGSKKGLLVGSYGYGSSNTIYVDPLYYVDYSPIPAIHLLIGDVDSTSDSGFGSSVNITAGVSDGNDATSYQTCSYGQDNGLGGLFIVDVAEYIWTSNDSGVNWYAVNTSFSGSLTNADEIVACSSGGLFIVDDNADIYSSNDGGVSWSLRHDDYNDADGTNVQAVNMECSKYDDSLYIVESDGDVWRSTNAGIDWIKRNDDYNGASGFTAQGMSTNMTGAIFIVDNNQNIWQSTDNGLTFSKVNDDYNGASSGSPEDYEIMGDEHFIVEGSTRDVYKSTNNGVSFSQVSSDFGGSSKGIAMTSNGTSLFIANGAEGIYRSDNGGVNWQGVSVSDINGGNGNLISITFSGASYNYSAGSAISGRWSQVYNASSEWFLRLRKTTSDSRLLTVIAYSSSGIVNSSVSVSDTLVGTGWFNINVSSLMYYETVVESLNFTEFRFYTGLCSNFSEVYLRESSVDNESPQIFNCQVDNTNLTSLEVARFQCNITDDTDVDFVNGTIEGVEHDFTQSGDVFYYDWQCISTNPSVDWTLVQAVDLAGNYNSTNPNISISCTYNESETLGNASISLLLYYSPFAEIGVQQTIYAVVKNESGDNYPSANVTIHIDGSNASMAWDNVSLSYIVYWIPSVLGDYPFNVTATTTNESVYAEGSITVFETYQICVRLWNNINMTPESRYLNEFAWVYAQKNLEPSMKRLFGRDMYSCPPQASDPKQCTWHGEYDNGTACITLYEQGNYTLYIVGNNIQWNQQMPSGIITDCEFCEPHVIQKRFLLNLGNYYFEGSNETLDLYYSSTELWVSGAFFGIFTSWVGIVLMAVIALVSFVGILWLTHSLKSAMVGLVVLPTIIWMITSFTLP